MDHCLEGWLGAGNPLFHYRLQTPAINFPPVLNVLIDELGFVGAINNPGHAQGMIDRDFYLSRFLHRAYLLRAHRARALTRRFLTSVIGQKSGLGLFANDTIDGTRISNGVIIFILMILA